MRGLWYLVLLPTSTKLTFHGDTHDFPVCIRLRQREVGSLEVGSSEAGLSEAGLSEVESSEVGSS